MTSLAAADGGCPVLLFSAGDTVRITGVSPPEAIQPHHQAENQIENESE